ncbi:MAG: hypothetical protein AAB152_13505 [Candidatus Coatesbacteria bacterium]
MRRMLALLLAVTAGRAVATSTAKPLNLPMSVRQMGMGDVSAAGADTLRAWSNPGILGWQESRGEVAINGSSLFGAEATTMGFGAGWAFTPEITGGLLVSTYSVSFDQVDATGASTGAALSQRSMAVGLGGAYRSGVIALGATVKFVSDSVGAIGASSAAADIGLAASTPNGVRAGLAYRNIGGTLGTPVVAGISTDGMPGEFRAGVAYAYAPLKLTGGVEYSMPVDADARAGLGAEWWPVPMVALRAGMSGLQATQRQLTFGLSAVFSGIGLDYALGSHPLGPVHRFSLSYLFGASARSETSAAEPALAEAPAAPAPAPAAMAPAPKRTAAARKVAVAPFASAELSDVMDAESVASELRTDLGRRATLYVLAPKLVEAAANGRGMPRRCTTEDCAVQLGKALAADGVVLGAYEKIGGSTVLNLRLVTVAYGDILVNETVKCDSEEGIRAALGAFAGRVAKALK